MISMKTLKLTVTFRVHNFSMVGKFLYLEIHLTVSFGVALFMISLSNVKRCTFRQGFYRGGWENYFLSRVTTFGISKRI